MKAGLSHICLMFLTHTHTLLSSTPALHAAIKKTVKSKNQYLARWEGSHTHTQTKAGRREEARGRTKGGGARSTGVQRRRYNIEVPDRGHIEHTKQKNRAARKRRTEELDGQELEEDVEVPDRGHTEHTQNPNKTGWFGCSARRSTSTWRRRWVRARGVKRR